MTVVYQSPGANLAFRGLSEAMAKIRGADVEVDHIAIGEALFWGITIDELLMKRFPTTYESAREGDPNGAGVDGARLARNAIAHGAILVHSYQGGMTFPMTFPAMFGMPLWRPVDELLRAWSPRATHDWRGRLIATEITSRRDLPLLQSARCTLG